MYYPDISHWKPVKNWGQVKEACPFIISKATQGTNYIDTYLNEFIAGCERYAIPYWLYTFLNQGNELAQAKYMVDVCKARVGKHFQGYVLDVEQKNPASGVKAALYYIKTQSEKTMIYTMYAQYSLYSAIIADRGDNCAWWEARYGLNTGAYSQPCHTGADLHQYTSKGTCPGIGSEVDLNRIIGSKKESWYTGADIPVQPIKEGEEMQCTFSVDGKDTKYWFDGQRIHTLTHPDQLKVIRQIYKDNNGKDMPDYKWNKLAPWYIRLQQAIDGKTPKKY